jgi:hypothetical protein
MQFYSVVQMFWIWHFSSLDTALWVMASGLFGSALVLHFSFPKDKDYNIVLRCTTFSMGLVKPHCSYFCFLFSLPL